MQRSCLVTLALVAACNGDQIPRRVTVPARSSFGVAADSLAAAGLIWSTRMFRWYAAAVNRDRTIRAGTYEFSPQQSWSEILDALESGKGIMHTVTIPEGFAITRIAEVLSQSLGVPPESIQVAVRDTALRRRLNVPTPTIEGYLFPDTYSFLPGTSARQAVERMVERFEAVWKPAWDERGQTLAMSRHDLVALAAIIETEARVPAERPVISAVYHNRLRIGMRLQADPTVQYALGRHVERVLYRDLEVDSRYNTYKYAGLPPGPIASPGAASLDAAANPAKVPYLYFVAHPDGHHEFRSTFDEHALAIRLVKAAAKKQRSAAQTNATTPARTRR